MLSVLCQSGKLCDGVTRREAMRVGGLSLFAGMTLPRLFRAEIGRASCRERVSPYV